MISEKERIMKIETQVENIERHTLSMSDMLKSHLDREDDWRLNADTRYSGQWVETVMKRSLIGAVVAFIGIVWAFIVGK